VRSLRRELGVGTDGLCLLLFHVIVVHFVMSFCGRVLEEK
jgi:hypothetical protein